MATTMLYNTTTIDDQENHGTLISIDYRNAGETRRLVPLIVYLGILAVTGFIGNLLVCYVYGAKFKQSNSRTFVLFLAIVDLASCAVVMPLEIVTARLQYTFYVIELCKISRFLNSLPTMASAGMLVAISVDRYRKLCCPLHWQISVRVSRVLCGVTVVWSLLLSWPAIIMYGRQEIKFEEGQPSGVACSIDDKFQGTVYPFMYNAALSISFLAAVLTLCVMYVFVARAVAKHVRTSKKIRSNDRPSSSFDLADNPERQTKGSTLEREQRKRKVSSSSTFSGTLVRSPSTPSTVGVESPRISLNPFKFRTSTSSNGKSTNTDADSWIYAAKPRLIYSRSTKKRQSRAKRTTFLMFLISLAFVLSFVPHLTLVLLRTFYTGFDNSLDDTGRAVYKFFLRSYFVNSAVNPLIYGLYDKRFRIACKAIFKKIAACCGK